METNKSESSEKSLLDCFDTNVWQIFSKTNLFACCCIAAFLSLVST